MDVTTLPTKVKTYSDSGYFIGLILAIISSLFIGSSFILKKLSLIRLNKRGNLRAGAGGFGYLFDWLWWMGLLTMGIGEFANFTAYAFAPASLVTPLGALSVLVSALLASKFLNEKLNLLGKLGCGLCLIGATLIVIHSPKEEEIESTEKLLKQVQNVAFINYVITVLVLVVLLLFFVGPRYGSRHPIIYLLLCSSTGSLTVMACKALGLSIKEISVSFYGASNFLLPLVLFVIIVFCVCLQMMYLNKALDLFSTTIVTPIYYVLFTTLVIIASAILFDEWKHMSYVDVLGAICGFLVTIVAIFLLQFFKDNSPLFSHHQRSISSQYGANSFETRTV